MNYFLISHSVQSGSLGGCIFLPFLSLFSLFFHILFRLLFGLQVNLVIQTTMTDTLYTA